jgi:hypothetical protein
MANTSDSGCRFVSQRRHYTPMRNILGQDVYSQVLGPFTLQRGQTGTSLDWDLRSLLHYRERVARLSAAVGVTRLTSVCCSTSRSYL